MPHDKKAIRNYTKYSSEMSGAKVGFDLQCTAGEERKCPPSYKACISMSLTVQLFPCLLGRYSVNVNEKKRGCDEFDNVPENACQIQLPLHPNERSTDPL